MWYIESLPCLRYDIIHTADFHSGTQTRINKKIRPIIAKFQIFTKKCRKNISEYKQILISYIVGGDIKRSWNLRKIINKPVKITLTIVTTHLQEL